MLIKCEFRALPRRAAPQSPVSRPTIGLFNISSFTAGVLVTLAVQYSIQHSLKAAKILYVALIISLLLVRYLLWRQRKMELYLLDFCYFVNALVLLAVQTPKWWGPRFWKMLYIFSLGPVGIATVAWRCSLVFHSLDKVTTVLVHIFPGCVLTLYRWQRPDFFGEGDGELRLTMSDSIYSLGGYLIWQALYLCITEILLQNYLKRHPDAHTSLRQLTGMENNVMNRITTRYARVIGVFGSEEKFDLERKPLKAKSLFVVTQLIYTFITSLPAKVLFNNHAANCTFLVLVLAISIYEGASYYSKFLSVIPYTCICEPSLTQNNQS